MTNPLVSIIVPVFNRYSFIGETLDSVLAQTYQNWECIVVDDGSSGYTFELLGYYCETDPRFRLEFRPREKPKGANSCRNYGFEKSKGDFVQFLDSDDLLSPNKIEEQIRSLGNNEDNTVAICSWVALNNKSSQILKNNPEIFKPFQSPKELFDRLGEFSSFLPPHSYLVKRKQIIRGGCWNEHLSINQDGEFFSRLLLTVDKVVFNPDCVVYYRRNSDRKTSSYDSSGKAEDVVLSWKIIEQQHRLRYKIAVVPYVEGAKKVIFRNLSAAGYGRIVRRNFVFFSNQYKTNLVNKVKVWLRNHLRFRLIKRFLKINR